MRTPNMGQSLSSGAALRINQTIYLDHQATTPMDPRVVKCMEPYYRETFGNPHSDEHILGWMANSAVEEAASIIANYIGADSNEIIFTSGATEANNLALLGIARSNQHRCRNRILVSTIEHKCILAAAQAAADFHGFIIELIPVDTAGVVDLSRLETMLDEDVLLVSIMAVNNEIGTQQPIEKIGKLAVKYGAIYHTDAAQAPLTLKLDVGVSNIGLASFSAHKIYGPKGIGCLYIDHELQDQIEPLIYGGGQQKNLRSGTVPVPLCAGMAAAVELLSPSYYQTERLYLSQQRDRFVELLRDTGWPLSINGPNTPDRHPGNANIQFHGFSAYDILGVLQPMIAAATGSACTSGTPEPSHVLTAIGLTQMEAKSSIRFSLGRHTSYEDIEEAAATISIALKQLDSIRAQAS